MINTFCKIKDNNIPYVLVDEHMQPLNCNPAKNKCSIIDFQTILDSPDQYKTLPNTLLKDTNVTCSYNNHGYVNNYQQPNIYKPATAIDPKVGSNIAIDSEQFLDQESIYHLIVHHIDNSLDSNGNIDKSEIAKHNNSLKNFFIPIETHSAAATFTPSQATFTPFPATFTPSPATVSAFPATFTPSPATFTPSPAIFNPSPATVSASPATVSQSAPLNNFEQLHSNSDDYKQTVPSTSPSTTPSTTPTTIPSTVEKEIDYDVVYLFLLFLSFMFVIIAIGILYLVIASLTRY